MHDPEALHSQIRAGVLAGLGAELADDAQRLVALEGSERAVVLAAIVLTRARRLDEAETILRDFIAARGETGVVLTNLAKLTAERGDEAEALSILERALELDPNQENALEWWVALLDSREGKGAGRGPLAELAERSSSWRPRLVLADLDLRAGDLASAERLYREVLRTPVPEAVQHVAARLAELRRPELVVAIVEKAYDLERHDPKVGVLLAQAMRAIGRTPEGDELQRKVQLRHASTLADHAEVDVARDQRPDLGSMRAAERLIAVPIVGPAWSASLSIPEWLVPRAEGKLIAFAGFANLTGRADANYLARALPLYIAELVREQTRNETVTLVTAIEGRGPFVAGERWTLPAILDLLPPHLFPDLFVIGAIEGQRVILEIIDPAQAQATELSIPDAGRAGAELVRWLGRPLPPTSPHELHLRALDALARQLVQPRANLDPPEAESFRIYAELLEQVPGMTPKLIAIAALLAAPRGTSPEHEALVLGLLAREDAGSPIARLAPLVRGSTHD